MNNLFRDLRFGIRMLLKGRGVSAIILVTLALTIGITSTIVSLVGAVLVHPFPGVKDPARVVWLFERQGDELQSTANEKLSDEVPVTNFFRWKAETTHFQDIAAIAPVPQTVSGAEPVRVKGFATTPNYFRLMGTKMAFGRDFSPDDDLPGRDQVAILGYAFAERRFGSPAKAVGQTITTEGRVRTIIGVLTPGFGFPRGLTDLWIPLVIDPAMRANRSETWLIVLGRLKPGATTASANDEIAAIAPRLAAEFPDTNRGKSAQALTLPQVFIGKGRHIVLLTLLVVILTLFIAATNVGNILFAQGAARRAEFALRAALGAPRGTLIRQLLTEYLILCAAGGALGLLVSMWSLDLFVATMPERVADLMRLYWELRFDASWVMVAMGVTLLTTVLAGIWPAWRVSETAVGEALKEQGNHATSTRGHRRILRGLVTAQVGVALVLLAGAACVVVDLVHTERRKLGFEPTAVLSAQVGRDRTDDHANAQFFGELGERLRAIPGVTAVGLASVTPLSRGHDAVRLAIPGRPPAPPGEEPQARLTIVDGDYFKAAAIEVIEGNVFTPKDDRTAPAVAMLSRRAAETLFPGQGAIGKTIIEIERKSQTSCTIIGIVDDIAAYRDMEIGMVYRPFAQEPRAGMSALVRGENPSQFDRPLRDAVYALDHGQPVETRLLRVHVDEFLWAPRTTARLIAIPAALAMLLAVLGVYGLAAYSVTQRRPELGIRAALGASPRTLVRIVMQEALWIAGVGGTAGLCLALLMGTALQRAGVDGLSPGWMIGLAAALVVIVLFASYGPAKRAASVSPSLAMRS